MTFGGTAEGETVNDELALYGKKKRLILDTDGMDTSVLESIKWTVGKSANAA